MEENVENGPQISEYKGRPVITLNPGDRYPFTFGVSKAKLLLENLEHIKKFVEDYDK
ncbi:hypothetical protein JW935_04390 [candidate division KSB1 bacterium]|nr:hypothetical protein [candidate division KSB1 bacterium]